jgi:hypothetical protein
MSHREDERELVRRAQEGDSRAFDRLMAALEPELRDFLRGRLRSFPHVALEDVMQEVRLYLFRRLDRYNPEYPVGAFARGLAANVAKRFAYGRSDLAPAGVGDDGEERSPSEISPQELGKLPLAFRRAVGEGRFERPGGTPGPSRTFLELFEVFVRYGGYPHQQVAFGYSVLLWGKEKRRAGAGAGGAEDRATARIKVPVTGDPDRVVREVGPRGLRSAAGGMLEDIGETCRLDAEYLGRVRRPLESRLEMTGAELFRRDPASRDRHAELDERQIGDTRLREYFGPDPRRSVSDWTHSVKNRVKKMFLDPAARGRGPLPEPSEARSGK